MIMSKENILFLIVLLGNFLVAVLFGWWERYKNIKKRKEAKQKLNQFCRNLKVGDLFTEKRLVVPIDPFLKERKLTAKVVDIKMNCQGELWISLEMNREDTTWIRSLPASDLFECYDYEGHVGSREELVLSQKDLIRLREQFEGLKKNPHVFSDVNLSRKLEIPKEAGKTDNDGCFKVDLGKSKNGITNGVLTYKVEE